MRIRYGFSILLAVITAHAQNVALFWNLYDAVVTGGRILHDVSEGVGAVSKAIHAIDLFLDTSAVQKATEEGGEGSLPDVETKGPPPPEPTEDTQGLPRIDLPRFNGCSALGFHVRNEKLPMDKLTDCCSQHEQCYGASCGSSKKGCDGKLKQCLYGACDPKALEKGQQKACWGVAKLLFTGTMALSFQQYSEAREALSCSPGKHQKHYKRKEKRRRTK